MKSFIKEFLNENWDDVPGVPRVYVAAFGKHPGWNDHMDDVGLVTESLVETKRCAYVQGVSSQIASGAWDRLGSEKALDGFDHIFSWTRPCEAIVGLIWSSRDGKGRMLYPMMLCAHVTAQPLDWVWTEVMPRLEAAAEFCRNATTQKGVIVALNTAQEALRRRSTGPSVVLEKGILSWHSPLGVPRWAEHFHGDRDALRRVCHHLAAHLSGFAGPAGESETDIRSRSLRLPAVPGASTSEALNTWLRFLYSQLNPFWPILLLKRRTEEWVDAIVGEPTKDDFFRLRAGPTAEPVVANIPYTVTDEFEALLKEILDAVASGEMPGRSFLSGNDADEMLETARQRLRALRGAGATSFFTRLLVRGWSSGGQGR